MGDSKEQPDEFGDAKMIGEPDSAGSFANVEAIERDGGATPATLVASSMNGVEAQLLPTTGSGDSVFDFERWTSMVVIKGQSSCRFTFRDPCSSLNYGLLNDAHPHPPSPPPPSPPLAPPLQPLQQTTTESTFQTTTTYLGFRQRTTSETRTLMCTTVALLTQRTVLMQKTLMKNLMLILMEHPPAAAAAPAPTPAAPAPTHAAPAPVPTPALCWFKTAGCTYVGKHTTNCSTFEVSGGGRGKRKRS